ncbi:phosphoribose diphosphate:decaprenyl-phosphate phosphoribosyltransferase [compost metagenome]
MYISLALTIVFYSLWTVDPITIEKTNSNYLIWTVPLVIIICMKYSLNIETDSDGDPVEVILKDKTLSLLILLFSILVMTIIYI